MSKTEKFDSDRIYVGQNGVIFVDTEKEEIQKFELPFVVYPSGEIKETSDIVYSLLDVSNLLDCELVRFIHKVADNESTDVLGNVLCVVSASEKGHEKLETNSLAKLIAWRMQIQPFGDKVTGPALFLRPQYLEIDLSKLK